MSLVIMVALVVVAVLGLAVMAHRATLVAVPVDISHLLSPKQEKPTEPAKPVVDPMVVRAKGALLLEEIRPAASESIRFVELEVALRECSNDELPEVFTRIDAFHAALGAVLEQRAQVAQRRARVDEVAELWRGRLRDGRPQAPDETPAEREMRSIFFG